MSIQWSTNSIKYTDPFLNLMPYMIPLSVTLKKYEASFNRIYGIYRSRCKRTGVKFDISKDHFREIAEQNCHYCGAEPTPADADHSRLNGTWSYNSLDRIDNSKGYLPWNVQACCHLCNRLKSDLEEEDFLRHISHIVSYLQAKHITDD